MLRETARAKQAWADYLSLGPERSFEKLVALYRSRPEAGPTRFVSTLKTWSFSFGWQARLAQIAEAEAHAAQARESAARAALQEAGIRDRLNRLSALDDRWRRLQAVIDARAADPAMAQFAGGDTGLLVRSPLLVKSYEVADDDGRETLVSAKSSELVETAALDVGLLKELREAEKQAAVELGQWMERREVSGNPDAPIVVATASGPEIVAAERAFLVALGIEPPRLGDGAGVDRPPDQGPG